MMYKMMSPLLFKLDGERAHGLSLTALKALSALSPNMASYDPILSSEFAGLRFASPVGLAPGYDKDAAVFREILDLGFGFTEVGTLTPVAQEGNPKPRLFRLPEDAAVINRMGFNNAGQDLAIARLKKGLERPLNGILGINIGANKDSDDRINDYCLGVRNMAAYADYLTVNISSPNTPGLRDLQGKAALSDLLSAVTAERSDFLAKSEKQALPIFLKVAPDLHKDDIDDICAVVLEQKIDAIIVSNTTISRPELHSKYKSEAGGLSGAPLKDLALQRLKDFRAASGGAIALIGVGGIANADDAYARIKAGASLVQLYSSMVYEGPNIGANIAKGLEKLLLQDGHSSVSEAVGSQD